MNNPGYKQFFKLSQIPAPANIFVFIDEHPDSINDGYFLMQWTYPFEWVDLPASYHNDSSALAFADGHCEAHQWHDASTLAPPRPDAADLPRPVAQSDGLYVVAATHECLGSVTTFHRLNQRVASAFIPRSYRTRRLCNAVGGATVSEMPAGNRRSMRALNRVQVSVGGSARSGSIERSYTSVKSFNNVRSLRK